MLTATQQGAIDRFAKSLATLSDDSLIDAHHQAWEDHRDARAEGSDNLGKAGAEVLRPKPRCEIALRIIKAATRRGTREPVGPDPARPRSRRSSPPPANARRMRFLEFFAANIRNLRTRKGSS